MERTAPPRQIRADTTIIYDIVDAYHGAIEQTELNRRTILGRARISRALSTLVEDGRVEKVRSGKTYLVQTVDQPSSEEDDAGPAIPRRPSER